MTSLRPAGRQFLRLLASRSPYSIPAVSCSHSTNTIFFHPHSKPASSGPIPAPSSLSTNQLALLRHVTTGATSSSEGQPSAEAKAKGRRIQVITGSLTALFGALYILYKQLHAKEEEPEEGAGQEEGKEEVYAIFHN